VVGHGYCLSGRAESSHPWWDIIAQASDWVRPPRYHEVQVPSSAVRPSVVSPYTYAGFLFRSAAQAKIGTTKGPSSLSDLSTKHERIGDLFQCLAVRRNIRIRKSPLAAYSSAKLLTPTGC
jgi:hypothetical protein